METRDLRLETELACVRRRCDDGANDIRDLRRAVDAATTRIDTLENKLTAQRTERLEATFRVLRTIMVIVTIALYLALARGFGWI